MQRKINLGIAIALTGFAIFNLIGQNWFQFFIDVALAGGNLVFAWGQPNNSINPNTYRRDGRR